MNKDPNLLVQSAMTEDQRSAFLAAVVEQNPNLQGAHVADVLDMMANQDAHLGECEAVHEVLSSLLAKRVMPLVRLCTFVSIYTSEERHADPFNVLSLVLEVWAQELL